MKKAKKFADLSLAEAVEKHSSLVKELVKFRISMDPASVQTEGGLQGLHRDLKVLGRKVAVSYKSSLSK